MTTESKYYPVKSFENIDPLQINHGYLLCVDGKSRVSLSHECSVSSVIINKDLITIELIKDYADVPADNPIALGARVVLKFYDAKIESAETNNKDDTLESATQLYDLVPVALTDDKQSEGYSKAIEIDAWDDGKYKVFYKSATVDFTT